MGQILLGGKNLNEYQHNLLGDDLVFLKKRLLLKLGGDLGEASCKVFVTWYGFSQSNH